MNVPFLTGSGAELPLAIIAGVILLAWYLVRKTARSEDKHQEL